MSQSQAYVLSSPPGEIQRSARSLAFEAFWRSLPRRGLIPSRGDFQPRSAIRFLPDLVLMESATATRRGLRIRLVGSAFQTRIRKDITGMDYAEFLSPEIRERALASVEMLSGHPCGLWQTMPVQYEQGFAQKLEVTVLPLDPGDDGIPLLLTFSQFQNALVHTERALERPIAAETATSYTYLDIGAGVPN
jgi:hypothetical protein